jgi:hypothetical protein
VKWVEYIKMMQVLKLVIPTHQTELDLPRLTTSASTKWAGDARGRKLIELVQMNFSLPPSIPKGGPPFNFRSERLAVRQQRTVHYTPASSFFEFTGRITQS